VNLNNNAFAQNVMFAEQYSSISVSLQSDNVKYVAGTPIRISGQVITPVGLATNPVAIIINTRQVDTTGFFGAIGDLTNKNVSTAATLARNGTYNILLTPISTPGHYKITASLPADVAKSGVVNVVSSSITIEVQELFYTRTLTMLYVGGTAGFIGLIFVILKAPRKETMVEVNAPPLPGLGEQAGERRWVALTNKSLSPNTYAVLRFMFLSMIAVTLMLAFALTDVQIAPISPFGLVIKTSGGTNTMTDNQWVVNIGGITANNYSTGVQVPVSVIIFGIAGGYLRFLYYTSKKERDEQQQEEPFYESLKDLALFFL
jgi:hypothetical protein